MYEEILEAHKTELFLNTRKIEQRMTWLEATRIDQLERALKKARSRLQMLPTLTTQAK